MSNSLYVVMLSTQKASKLFKSLSTGNLIVSDMSPNNNPSTQNQHLHLVDEGAHIDYGDAYLQNNQVFVRRPDSDMSGAIRILATTDPDLKNCNLVLFNDEVIQHCIENKDKSWNVVDWSWDVADWSRSKGFLTKLVFEEKVSEDFVIEEDDDNYPRYSFRNLLRSEVEEGWAVKGVYTPKDKYGIQEWCLSEEDAEERMQIMQESGEFTDLCIIYVFEITDDESVTCEKTAPIQSDNAQPIEGSEDELIGKFHKEIKPFCKIAEQLAKLPSSNDELLVYRLVQQLLYTKTFDEANDILIAIRLIENQSVGKEAITYLLGNCSVHYCHIVCDF